jgi:RNA polymerase sigma-70 factor (ECF subfamily)
MNASAIAAARNGDAEALEILVRAYHDRVYRFGLRSCRDEFDADDAVQEAFIKLARRPDVVRDPSVLSWLMTVVRRACAKMLRPFVRDARLLGEPVSDPDEVAVEDADAEAAVERWRIVRAVKASPLWPRRIET